MKLLKYFLVVSLLAVFSYADDISDNKETLKNLYEKVILKNANRALEDIDALKKSVLEKNTKKSKEDFAKLVKSWKSVQAFYLLGDLNEDFIDTPRYLDVFHNINEDITKQLDRAIKSDDEVRIALFKNSLKSINALEYIIAKKDIQNERVNKFALAIISKIESLLSEIDEEYKVQEKNFLSDIKKANSITINTLIQSTYKLKEWRIGDIIGETKKYQGKPDNNRAEYIISKNSSNAIEAILLTYKNIFNNKNYKDYGDYLLEITDGTQIESLRESIDKSLELVKEIKDDNLLKTQDLYEEVSNIHVILFLEIIEELSINAKIIEADGD
ncbi:imelysin family protein [Halarcobacter sp.]|uniref:imelysin family protein n=1 Tax=Halarcobacter sp. TaxID=2321133 RepID=UPI002AA70286|nr:imelysin family protein [Halarcobacter sp.]